MVKNGEEMDLKFKITKHFIYISTNLSNVLDETNKDIHIHSMDDFKKFYQKKES